MGVVTETVLQEEQIENGFVPEAKLQERVNHFFVTQKVLLYSDSLLYLKRTLRLKHGIGVSTDYLEKDDVTVPKDLVQALDSIIEDLENKGGIDPKYISKVKVVNPESAKDIVFEGKELLEKKLGYEFKSDEYLLQFFAGEDSERKSILQDCMEGKIEEFQSDFYLDILQDVDVLRKVVSGNFFVKTGIGELFQKELDNLFGTEDKVPGELLQIRLNRWFEAQGVLAYGSSLKYLSKRLEEYNIKRLPKHMVPNYLKGRRVPKKLLDAIDSITQDIESSGGINLEEAFLEKRVRPEKVLEFIDEALEIIEKNYRKRSRSNKLGDDYFAEILSCSWQTLLAYRKGGESTNSIFLKRIYDYVTRLNKIVTGELDEEIDLPDKYFARIDGDGNIIGKRRYIKKKPTRKYVKKKPAIKPESAPSMGIEEKLDVRKKTRKPEIVVDEEPEEKPVVRKTIPIESKVIFDRKSEEMLEYIWERQNIYPYNSCCEFAIKKLELDYDIILGKKDYEPKEVMSALESIANDIKDKGIKLSEVHLGSIVYSERIAELVEKIEEIAETKHKVKFRSLNAKIHYFAGIASTTPSIIKYCMLGEKGGGSKTGPSSVYQKLNKELGRVKGTEISFPIEYFYEIKAKS